MARINDETDDGGDMHSFWVDPENPTHFVTGHDIVISETFDNGRTWRRSKNLPFAQFRSVTVDRRKPFYHVYGESQDRSGIEGPVASRSGYGIPSGEWK